MKMFFPIIIVLSHFPLLTAMQPCQDTDFYPLKAGEKKTKNVLQGIELVNLIEELKQVTAEREQKCFELEQFFKDSRNMNTDELSDDVFETYDS